MNKYTAFIPARSGSKRLPNKNIKMLAGKPLVIWTIEACLDCDKIEKVIFSTDSDEYWELVREYFKSDRLVLDDRSSEEAGDKVKIFDYLKSASNKIFGGCEGKFIMALPTMPLRNVSHIEEAIKLSEEHGKAVFSAVEYEFAVSFAFSKNDDHSWSPVFDDSPMVTGNTRSQDQLQAYHPNGAIYIREISDLDKTDLNTIYQQAIPYIMDKAHSVDIDTLNDFMLAEAILNKS